MSSRKTTNTIKKSRGRPRKVVEQLQPVLEYQYTFPAAEEDDYIPPPPSYYPDIDITPNVAASLAITNVWADEKNCFNNIRNNLQQASIDEIINNLELFMTRVGGQIDDYRRRDRYHSRSPNDHSKWDENSLRYFHSIILLGELFIPFAGVANDFYEHSWES